MRQLRALFALAAAIIGTGMIAATAAGAQAPAGYYVAVPAQPAAKTTIIVRETAWKLRGDAYVAARSSERDAYLCGAVARDAGALTSFTVGGKAFDADQLAQCNAKAKGGAAGTAVAQAR